MRPRVFITQPVAPRAIERLRGAAEVNLNPDPLRVLSKAELCAAVRTHDILFCLVQDFVDRDVIACGRDGAGRTEIDASPAADDARPRMSTEIR